MTETIRVNINLDSLLGELQRSLQRVICLTGAGIQNIDIIDSKRLYIPTEGIQYSYVKNMNWDDKTAKEEYLQWVLTNSFRDSIESLNMFLESTHRVLSFWYLSEKQISGIQLTSTDLYRVENEDAKKFHKLGLPGKIEHLNKEHPVIFDDRLTNHIVSINKARNCFVHRNGIVSQTDLTDEKSLTISYRRTAMFLKNEDGIADVVRGMFAEKDSVIFVRNQDEKISFELGSRIQFHQKELTEIIWCLFLFGSDAVQKMNTYGIKKGLIAEKEDKNCRSTD